jgi:hypothetical protein
MIMKLQLIAVLALATLVAAPASAGPLKRAWVRQQVSIAHGVANGSIKPREFKRLEKREASILHQAAVLRATGGGLGPFERAYLGARLAGARGAIFFHKHN